MLNSDLLSAYGMPEIMKLWDITVHRNVVQSCPGRAYILVREVRHIHVEYINKG